MDRLWTPWRFQYLASGTDKGGCVFCRISEEDPARDRQQLVLARDPLTFTLLNLFPYTSGHLLVVLNRHLPTLSESSSEELSEMIGMARFCEQALRTVYTPQGFNIGFNVGACAGAGVAGHLHLHVVPRWAGDSNFVAVVGETRTLPEELETTYDKLLPFFENR